MSIANSPEMIGVDETAAIERQARDWVLRLRDPDGAAEAGDCAAWRAADPRHERAFQRARLTWSAIGRSSFAQDGAWRREASALQRSAMLKRYAPPAAAAAAAVLAVVLFAPTLQPVQATTYATRTAETRNLTLSDGSRVYVGARSDVRVKVDNKTRQVELKDGQAFFEVTHDPSRPFYVYAGKTVIRVVGTKFDVTRTGDEVKVSVLEGRVEVRTRALASLGPQMLTRGQQLVVDPKSAPSGPASIGVSAPGAWREGRLLYADARLKDVVADANRYSAHPIRLATPEIGDLRVTATFRTNAVADLVSNLDQALPIRSERESDGSTVLRPDGDRR